MTEFGKFLYQCPDALQDSRKLMGLMKDALQNDMPAFRVLRTAYELGILDALKRQNPLMPEDRMRIVSGFVSQYAMTKDAAERGIFYWEQSVGEDLFSYVQPGLQKKIAETKSRKNTIQNEQIKASNALHIRSIQRDVIQQAVRLQWERVPGAELYEIWRAVEQQAPVPIKRGSFPILRYLDPKPAEEVRCTYVIRGMDREGREIARSPDVQIIAPGKTAAFQIRAVQFGLGEIKIQWGAVFGALKYTLYRRMKDLKDWLIVEELSMEKTACVDHPGTGLWTYKVGCLARDGTTSQTGEIVVECVE